MISQFGPIVQSELMLFRSRWSLFIAETHPRVPPFCDLKMRLFFEDVSTNWTANVPRCFTDSRNSEHDRQQKEMKGKESLHYVIALWSLPTYLPR